jgi:hypothetical protein
VASEIDTLVVEQFFKVKPKEKVKQAKILILGVCILLRV